jgi:hypothetical protein
MAGRADRGATEGRRQAGGHRELEPELPGPPTLNAREGRTGQSRRRAASPAQDRRSAPIYGGAAKTVDRHGRANAPGWTVCRIPGSRATPYTGSTPWLNMTTAPRAPGAARKKDDDGRGPCACRKPRLSLGVTAPRVGPAAPARALDLPASRGD